MVLLIIGASVLIAITRGFTTEALSLVAWVLALFVTLQGHPILFPHIVNFVQPDFMASMITYAVLGILSLIIFKFIGGMIGRAIKESHIGALDRGLGILFGIARGMLLISFAYLLTTPFFSADEYPEMFMEAKSRPLIEYGASMLNSMNPYRDEPLFEEGRFGTEWFGILKNVAPSFPSSDKKKDSETQYDDKSREEMDNLIREGTKS
ncbi:MAG: CvpA family protein [Emcibacteraceae bacterium]